MHVSVGMSNSCEGENLMNAPLTYMISVKLLNVGNSFLGLDQILKLDVDLGSLT